jgi:Uma2 family endonuclease
METITLDQPQGQTKAKRKGIPKALIYEMRHGKPIYYRDYRKVLTNEKCLEEVMGCSALQGQLVAWIVGFLLSKLNVRKYAVMSNEAGFIYAPRSWRLLDIAIFDKKRLKKELLSTKYVKTAPKVVIEVDTKADSKNYGDILGYLTEKTEDLLKAGVEKVIWILTDTQKVVVAEQGKTWLLAKWNDVIPVVEDVTIQVEELVNAMTEEE